MDGWNHSFDETPVSSDKWYSLAFGHLRGYLKYMRNLEMWVWEGVGDQNQKNIHRIHTSKYIKTCREMNCRCTKVVCVKWERQKIKKGNQKKINPASYVTVLICMYLYVRAMCMCLALTSNENSRVRRPYANAIANFVDFCFFVFFCRDVRDFNFYSRIALPLCMYVFMCDANVFLFSPLLRRADRKMIFGWPTRAGCGNNFFFRRFFLCAPKKKPK